MNRWLRSLPRRLVLKSSVLLFLAGVAVAEEPGHLFVYSQLGGGYEIRKVRKLQRDGGFYIAKLYSGGSERFDASRVGFAMDLALLQPVNFKQQDDIANAKSTELNAGNAMKQYPQLASHLAPSLTRLRAEIERAERGEKKIDGQWLTAEQLAAFNARARSTIQRGSLELKNGTSYRDVEIVSVTAQELRIMHSDGAARIPLDLVPEDFKRKYLTPAPTDKGK